jgi:hypothetical protein
MNDITDGEGEPPAPSNETKAKIPPKFTTFRVTYHLREQLKALKKELGFRTYDALFNYTILEITREGAIPPASYDQVFEKLGSRPCIITGQSGAGKTTCVKDLLSQFGGNVFILDVSGEYTEFKDVDLGKFFSVNWGREGLRIRFVPNSNVEISRAEAATIFSHLNFVKNSGALKDWCLVVEEGHRFGTDPNFRALLIEARKFVRKLILVTTDWRQFGDIAKAFKPRPWEPVQAVQEELPDAQPAQPTHPNAQLREHSGSALGPNQAGSD